MARSYSLEELAFVKEAYRLMSLSEVTQAFNEYYSPRVTEKQIRSLIRNRKFKSGRSGKFESGSAPWNTGTKGVMKPNSGTFKKGNRPHTWVPVGTERKTTKDHYIKVKVAEPNVWEFKHLMVWESHNGPVPKGMCVVFKDGDRQNCGIDNLQLIDRGVLAQYNKIRGSSFPPELRTTVRAVAEIKVKSSRRLKGEKLSNGRT